jgi:hypothetical protein
LWKLTTGPEHAALVNEQWINSGIDNPALNQTVANRPFRPASEVINGVAGRGTPEEQQTYDKSERGIPHRQSAELRPERYRRQRQTEVLHRHGLYRPASYFDPGRF